MYKYLYASYAYACGAGRKRHRCTVHAVQVHTTQHGDPASGWHWQLQLHLDSELQLRGAPATICSAEHILEAFTGQYLLRA